MPQPLNVNAIKSFLTKNPPVIGNKFQILIDRGLSSAGENITMACTNINLPGQTFSTNPGGNPGPEVKYPYQVAYEDAVISFLTTGHLDQRIYFEKWMDTINLRTRTGYHRFGYRDDYLASVKIAILDGSTNGVKYLSQLNQVYPIAIQATELSHANEAIMTTNVTLTYVNYTSTL